jgi:CheY-like chemotaxis protein
MKSILIVDDEHAILLALEMVLTDEGYSVRTALNGKQALERLAEQRPDVVLLDVMMPVLSGPETIKHMKSDPEYAQIPIVLMSAVFPQFTQEEFPWDAFLRKPFEITRILAVIESVIAGKKVKPGK